MTNKAFTRTLNSLAAVTYPVHYNKPWDSEMEIDKNDVNLSNDMFLSKMNTIINKRMPIQKVKAKECKQQLKFWITPTITDKINTKGKLHKKLVKSKSRKKQLKFNKIKNEITSLLSYE